MSAGGRQSTVGGNALAKVSVNGTHLEAQMGALLSSVILPHHALEMPCAGYGRCGKCRVVAHGALSALSDAEREHLSPQDISRGVRLACCARVEGDCTVTLEGAAASQIRLAGEMPDFVHDPIFSVCGAAVDIGTTTLASCLYATFLGILEKKRIEIEGTEIVVEGEKRTEVPTTLKTVHLTVTIRGTDKEDAVRKSFDLATKYCSVYQTISHVAEMSYELHFA